MLRKALILLCSAAILVSAAGNADIETSSPIPAGNKTSDPEPIPHTTVPPTSSTTVSTTNTTKVTTPSTTTPTQTTTPHSTTTPPPTTTPPSKTTIPPSTTTTTTTTTTASAPTTKAPPTPVPLETGKWSLNGTNETCIVLQMAVQFEIMYPAKNTNKTASQKINLPVKNVTVSGSCDPKEQTITLSWNTTLGSSNDSFTIHFVKNESTKQYTIHHLELVILPQELPNYNSTSNGTLKFVHMQDEFHTGLSNSYRCANPPKFNLTKEGMNVKVGTVQFSNLQFQAFRSDKTTTFSLAEDCLTDTPDVVPIAVGCALAALVVIVLVAYLIGRRRAQARGYLSM